LFDWLSNLGPWLKTHPDLILPLLLSLGMAGCVLKTRRIPNYLTLGGALGGWVFNSGITVSRVSWTGWRGWG
jgi:hypothetical protein